MSRVGYRGRVVEALALVVLCLLLVFSNSIASDTMTVAWPAVFFLGAVGFGWAYAGEREPWAAITAYVSGALGLILVLALLDVENLWMPQLALILIGAPFLYVWYHDRAQWWHLIPAYAMFVLMLLFHVFETNFSLAPSYVLAALGLPFLYGWARDRAHWWCLVPGLIMLSLALLALIVRDDYNAIPGLVMAAVGMPFVVIAVISRKWPLLVPGSLLVLYSVGLGPALAGSYETFNTVTTLYVLLLVGGGTYLLWRGRENEEELPLMPERE